MKAATIAMTVKTIMGKGYAISATRGAMITIARVTKFAIPIDVAANNVGNIFGCVIQTMLKVDETPNLANATVRGKSQPGFALSILKIIVRPASA